MRLEQDFQKRLSLIGGLVMEGTVPGFAFAAIIAAQNHSNCSSHQQQELQAGFCGVQAKSWHGCMAAWLLLLLHYTIRSTWHSHVVKRSV